MPAKLIVRTAAAFAVIAATMSFAACGTSDAGDSNASAGGDQSLSGKPTDGYDVSGVKKDDAIAALLPQSVTQDGKFVVGMDTSYAPAEFISTDGKTPIGYEVDMAKALGNIFGLKTEPTTAVFDSIIPSVGSKYDVGISSFIPSPERVKSVDFVTYQTVGTAFVVKKGNPDKVDPDNLCGMKIAVQTGSTQEEDVNKSSDQCKASGKDPVDILSFKQQTDVTTSVMTGKAQAFYTGTDANGYAIKQSDGALEQLEPVRDTVKVGAAIKKGDAKTREAMQKGLQKLMDDGTFQKIMDYWGVGSTADEKAEVITQ
ncbi:ABC transporter substrate-binding protein [Bifidobacterium sp. 82T24]|uniref:ABC transporter substrate-binding protein n=1 Tax=Bifidobacterium pluvialisilvae TaxID=2834436 RepID=UPI001C59D81F|nr:ABC transporter substrate-binding protein [Bifidobacterium pluvialisilvae]MBW3088971.1 ABC transporter substrate-binding protein [Bifidobacterium pluvialisilvae]